MIRLSIEITSPLSPDDRDLLAGIAVMTVAIANREMSMEAEPDPEPQPCGAVATNPAGWVCVSNVGHRGRHRFRMPPQEQEVTDEMILRSDGMVN